MEIEIIKHAAMQSEDGQMIFLGKSHSDCYQQSISVGIEISNRSVDQGFFTNKGRYVDRKQAACFKCKKLKCHCPKKLTKWEVGQVFVGFIIEKEAGDKARQVLSDLWSGK